MLRFRHTSTPDALLLTAVVLIVIGATVFHWNAVLGRDVAHFLALAKVIGEGRPLYIDVVDQNTPGRVGVSLVSLGLARITGLPLDRSAVVVTMLIVSAAFALAWRVVSQWSRGNAAWSGSFALAAVVTLCIAPGFDFGTREHLFFACFLPYVVSVLAHHAGTGRGKVLSVAVAVAATFGLFLKPHFLIFLGATTAYELSRRGLDLRRWALETWLTLGLTGAAYGTFLVMEPTYLQTVAPFTLATYGQAQIGFWPSIGQNLFPVWLLAGVLVAASALAFLYRDAAARAILPLGWLYWGAGVALVGVQGMGFAYHALPLRWTGLLTGALACVWATRVVFAGSRTAETWPHPVVARALVALATVAVTLIAGRDVLNSRLVPARSSFVNHPMVKLLDRIGPQESVYLFSGSTVPGGWAVLYSHARWAGHMIPMYFLSIVADYDRNPRLYPEASASEMASVEAYERRRILDDFRTRRPALVLIDIGDHKRYMKREGFEYLSFLEEDPAFTAAWKQLHYEPAGTVRDFSGRPFAVYRRAPQYPRSS